MSRLNSKNMMTKRLLVVSSGGGHLTEALQIIKPIKNLDVTIVVNSNQGGVNSKLENYYVVSHSERDWLFFKNLIEAYKILKKTEIDWILSCGAGVAVPFCIIANIFFPNVKVLYVETITSMTKPSLTGRIMKYLRCELVYTSITLKAYFPKGKFIELDSGTNG